MTYDEGHATLAATGRSGMTSRLSRTIAGGAAALVMLAGCTSGLPVTAEGADGSMGEVDAARGSVSDGAADSERPRESADPCEGRNDDAFSHNRCDVVAWADLNLDGTLNPIAVATGGEPSIRLLTVIGGQTLEYNATYDPDTIGPDAKSQVIGPDVGSMEARRHATFVGAYDMTGDGRPELVMWVDKGPTVDTFRVVRVGSDGLTSLTTPQKGMYGGGKQWAHPVFYDHPSFRCTGDSDAPLEHLALATGQQTATSYEFDTSNDEFVSLNGPRPTRGWTGEVPTVGVDCQDHAQHEPTPDPNAGSGPYERCPLGQLPGTPQTDDLGAFIEGTRTAGEIGCERIAEIWEEYDKTPKDTVTNGKAMIVDFGGHTCSMSVSVVAEQSGKIGACTAQDHEWAFDVVPR